MAERPQPSFLRRTTLKTGLKTAFVLLLSTLWIPPTASAQDLYAVTDIAVDERASNEVEAKQIGVANAKREAFAELMRRLTLARAAGTDSSAEEATATAQTGTGQPATAVGPPPVPDDDRLEFMIRDMSFVSEKFGGGRYLASLTVRFQPEAVNRYLQRSGTAYLGSPSPLAVILPIFRDEGGDQLWSDTNPWLDAWWRLEGNGVVVPYTVPLGDLSDIGAIDAKRAVAVDPAGINGIAARYRAGAVAVPIATFGQDGGVLVELSTFGAGWPGQPALLQFTPSQLTDRAAMILADEAARDGRADQTDPNESASLLFAAASLTLEAMEERWKSENILRFDEEASKLTARVDLTGLDDWLSVRTVLNEVASIKTWRLAELATSHAVVEIDYIGDTERLNRALGRASFGLTPGQEGEVWNMVRR